jgi:GT2 family glycosyltransferase
MRVGVVVIGRNEGERLRRCLASIVGQAEAVVYVDSGSTDGSVELARSLGVGTVDLDMGIPFTAARARNAGFTRLRAVRPDLDYVQFVDGDCELAPGWLPAACEFLDAHAEVAMVCGRLRERHPDRSIYNRLCDIEWDAPTGESRACGGNALARIEAVAEAGGFRENLIAGEEPELCFRLRASGWKIWRLSDEMAWHDAAMTRFGQWWRRTMRGGYAFAEGAHLHGATAQRYCVRESWRAWLWGILLPLTIVVATLFDPIAIVLLLAYPLQVLRLTLRSSLAGRIKWLRSIFLVLSRFPEGAGQIRFLLSRLRRQHGELIEYK